MPRDNNQVEPTPKKPPYSSQITEADMQISAKAYRWTERAFSLVRKSLKVKFNFSGDAEDIENGDIFLFNHFARFETLIPQYFFYQRTGAFSRSVASSEFFAEDDAFANYLLSVGAVPNDYPNILEFLAKEILRGHKVVIFPEGGMIKNRKVLDEKGKYAVYSPTAQRMRKHHSGAAVLALVLDLFKQKLAVIIEEGNWRKLDSIAESMEIDVGKLFHAAQRPTLIVPANITFYPIRVRDNLLTKGMEWIGAGLSKRITEELLVEGNILLEDTDMDIRLSRSISVRRYHSWWGQTIEKRFLKTAPDLSSFFEQARKPRSLLGDAYRLSVKRSTAKVRDQYMHRIYTALTINLSHLASILLLRYVELGSNKIDLATFNKTLYLAVKTIQRLDHINLHDSLRVPDIYSNMLENKCEGINRFLQMACSQNLIEIDDNYILLLEAIKTEHEFDEIRLNNLIEVYANEVAPMYRSIRRVYQCLKKAPDVDSIELAMLRMDDERIQLAVDKAKYSQTKHDEINRQQTATASATPYLFRSESAASKRKTGVLLVHGFLASPAELRGLGRKIHDQRGYTVLGVRLKGHGTSPWDLRKRSYEEWLQSIQRGYDILKTLCDDIVVVGFSTGGSLALSFAADNPQICGICAINVPLKFQNKVMFFVPLVHHTNKFVRSVTSLEGMFPFRANETENPTVNYSHMPVRGLYELTRLNDHLQEKVGKIKCPAHIVQADEDPVVDSSGIQMLKEKMKLKTDDLTIVKSDKHGIVYRDIDNAQEKILNVVDKFLSVKELPMLEDKS